MPEGEKECAIQHDGKVETLRLENRNEDNKGLTRSSENLEEKLNNTCMYHEFMRGTATYMQSGFRMVSGRLDQTS